MVLAYAVRVAALFHGRLYLHVFVPGGVISKMCCRTSSCALVMADGLGQPGKVGSFRRCRRGSRTSDQLLRLLPSSVKESLRVHHSRFRAAQRAVVPHNRFCAHNHQLLAILLGQRGSLLQDWIEDCLQHLSFHGWSFPCC